MRLRALFAAALCVALLGTAPHAPAAEPKPPRLAATAWALVDARSGGVLASSAANRRLLIASTTKLMTAYVAMEKLPLGKRVRAAPYTPSYAESLLGLKPRQRISVRDLLYGLILRSGNDAAHALAVAAAGSVPAFVRQMNRHAAALGLSNTHYANPIGLDQAGNYSTALDLTALARRLLDDPVFARIAAARSAVLRSVRPPLRIETRNDLLRAEPWATGVKTGYTLGAGYVLVGSGKRNGVELISAVLGTASEAERDLQSERLLDYGFSLYRKRTALRAGKVMARPEIRYAGGELPLRAERTIVVGLRRGQRLRVEVTAPRRVEGPLQRGRRLGRAEVYVDGRRYAVVPLRAGRSVPEASALQKARSALFSPLGWIAIAASAILLAAGLLRGRRQRRRQPRRRAREAQ